MIDMAGVLYDPTKPMPLIQMVNSPQWIGVKPTVGQRNNNPGNLRSFDAFQGKTGQGKGGYDIYDTLDNGARALARDLHTKSKRGVKTVRELMTGYAPPSDNNPTGSYIDYVANDLGVDPDQEIDIASMRPTLMRSITKFENKNRDILSDDMIAQAIAAADGESPDMPNQNVPPGGYPSIAGPLADGQVTTKDLTDQANRFIAPDGFYADQIPLADMQRLGANPYPVAAVDEGALTFDDVMARQGDARQAFQDQYTAANPALTMPGNDTQTSPGILANAGNYTNNTRSQTPLSITPPTQNIDFAERMVRMGAAGLGAMNKGPGAQMAAMGEMDGKIADYNRARSLELYEQSLERQKAQAKTYEDDADTILKYDHTLAKFDRGLGYVQGQGLTGPWDGFVKGFLDQVNGNEDAAKRLLLQELKVDDVLIRIAQTKGAISNKEMEIFMKPAPSVELSDEGVWRTWIEEKAAAMRSVRNKLAQRSGVALNTGPISGAGNQAASNNLDAARAIISQR